MSCCVKEPETKENKTEMTFVKSLGEGSSGSVDLFSCKKHDGSTLYNAVKTSDSTEYESIDREFGILSELRGCPGIVQVSENTLLQETDSNGNEVYKMVMEYASAGTLTSFIERNGKLSESVIKDFTRMILQGLVSIHSHGYVHCDLKPENLLLFPRYDDEQTTICSYELKISDFGLSTKSGERSDCWRVEFPFVGTPLYMSPESVNPGDSVEQTLDLYSLGCIVLVMYTGKHPWKTVPFADIKHLLVNGEAPMIPYGLPCDASQFVEKCLAINPKKRGTASELLLHPFLTGGYGVDGGERRRVGLRFRKPPERFEDIANKPSKLKAISSFLSFSGKP